MPDVFAGRFELIDPIGSGGTGIVWRAWDRRLERLCAAKVLRQRHAGALLRFVREQGLRLEHPNVLSPYGWAADDDQALLAMDLVGGGSVSSLVADFGALPERYAAELLAQLLRALEQVHAAGLVHRDVKPANLLLETTGTGIPVLRLSDFGIALSLGEPRLTQHGAVVGTRGYVAPEAFSGEPPSTKQDLYAAGVTAWQLLTGEEPPAAGPLPSRPNTTGTVWALVESLIHSEPARRSDSAKAALESLAPVLSTALQIPAHTADGELIEVFNQLPPLPTPYTNLPTSPATPPAAPNEVPLEAPSALARGGEQAARAAGSLVRPGAGRPAESWPTAASSAELPTAPVAHGAPGDPAGQQPAGTKRPEQEHTAGAPADRLTPLRAAAGVSPAAGRPVRRRLVLGGVGLVGLVAAGVVGVLLLDGGEEGGGSQPTVSPSVSPSGTPSSVPTGPVTRAPNAQLEVGDPCGWQEAGAVESTADGTRVECRQQGSSYLWIKA
ncbi:serine/threonine-protein kinase [Kribbella orskensis]|uniref:non-specific serine/threonine protein kinase n=1 Tax=Kribbella orskensis TaxID=2512216 RepID=A0ABY2BEB5_9ACTN|nr:MULTISPECIES: serine/threonine-protein kinase [Kribbella]TCN36557.1 serine/threonine-protein kinase [Kribbella sp. VKM Ac-2500]TCO17796.1 serine/threonine-protein kinase [Kribbella orskensis]